MRNGERRRREPDKERERVLYKDGMVAKERKGEQEGDWGEGGGRGRGRVNTEEKRGRK